jgi:hypothetical protein
VYEKKNFLTFVLSLKNNKLKSQVLAEEKLDVNGAEYSTTTERQIAGKHWRKKT